MSRKLGHLVLVVGPSGAGKDSVINGAKLHFANSPGVVFPRRVVTRKSVALAEDHDTLTELQFSTAVSNGEFSIWWKAHDNSYGIPHSIEGDIRSGRTIIFNCSRDVIAEAAAKFLKVTIVEITAPRDVLVERIIGRGRENREQAILRVSRQVKAFPPHVPVVQIENSGMLDSAVETLCRVIAPNFQRRLASAS